MSATNTTTDTIRTYVFKQFPLAKKKGIDDEAPLLDSGVVDSLGILEIVNFLEEEFGISITDEELLPDNFSSIVTLAGFVEKKQAGKTA